MQQNILPIVPILHPGPLVQSVEAVKLLHDVIRQLAIPHERVARQNADEEESDRLQHHEHDGPLEQSLEEGFNHGAANGCRWHRRGDYRA